MTTGELAFSITRDAGVWRECLGRHDWKAASEVFVLSLEMCKRIWASSPDPVERNAALLYGILVRGLQNSGDLAEIMGEKDVSKDTDKIERAWTLLCDAQDRLGYASRFIDLDPLTWIVKYINSVDYQFSSNFGPGMFMSPEILVHKERCSVCAKDLRCCEHIVGALYGGVRCTGIVEGGIELRTVAVVTNPKDRRCRIWPWRFTADNRCEVPIATTFRVDDFVDDWTGTVE